MSNEEKIEQAYRRWNGLPMNLMEIAEFTGVNYEVIKGIANKAVKKMRRSASPEYQEYAD